MSDEVTIETSCWDGKGEAHFYLTRHRASTITVWVEHEDLTIDGLDCEGDTSVRIPMVLIKRAIAAAENACQTNQEPT